MKTHQRHDSPSWLVQRCEPVLSEDGKKLNTGGIGVGSVFHDELGIGVSSVYHDELMRPGLKFDTICFPVS
jgi:hypothetical protein